MMKIVKIDDLMDFNKIFGKTVIYNNIKSIKSRPSPFLKKK